MKKTYFILFSFLLLGFASTGQNKQPSLIDSLALSSSSKERVELSLKLSDQLKHEDWNRALFYLELAEKEIKNTEGIQLRIDIYNAIGDLYNLKDVLDVSLEFYLKSYNLLLETNKYSQIHELENNLAIIYARLQDKSTAESYFKKVYDYEKSIQDTLRIVQVINNIALLNLQENPDTCLAYLEKAFQYTNALNDSVLNTYLYTNLARAHAVKGDYQLSLESFKQAESYISEQTPGAQKSFVLSCITEFYISQKKYLRALEYSEKVKVLIASDSSSFGYQRLIKNLYTAHKGLGNFEKATELFDKYLDVTNSLNIEEKAVNVERLKLKQAFKTKEKLAKIEREKELFRYYLIALSLLLLIIVLGALLLRYRSKIAQNKLKQDLLLSKQEELKSKLEAKNKALIAKAMSEMTRTDIITDILNELKAIGLKAVKKETQDAIDYISNKLERDLNTDLWEEFEISFKEVHESFYTALHANHPDITSKDRRLCALLYLDLSSKEISQITGQSFKSIENSRTRLRKKLNLTNTKTSLSNYLNELGRR